MLNAKARHDPEDLNDWGRAAAMLYINKAASLSQAVHDIVKDKELTAEHLKRIIEVANVAAYLAEYDRMPGPSRVVMFPDGPATYQRVIALFEKTAGVSDMLNEDYASPPNDYKVEKLVRDVVGMEKAASDFSGITSLDDIAVGRSQVESLDSLYFKVNSAIDKLSGEVIRLGSLKQDLYDRLQTMLKEAIVDGNSLGDIRRTASPSRDSALDSLLVKVANSLSHTFPGEKEVLASFKSVSFGRVPSTTHPIRNTFAAYKQVLDDIRVKTASIHILKEKKNDILSKAKELSNDTPHR